MRWQGWLLTAVFIGVIILLAYRFNLRQATLRQGIGFLITFVLVAGLYCWIAYKKCKT
ncbi:MAG: hypothetical protein JW893_05470 [Candidatus Omnitrophica bacterium]|nr:hypothetical protein [Candidatus Omnitrophota bacterium]